MKTCPDCNGDGVVDKGTDEEQRCPTCGGLGFVPDDDDQEEVLNTAALPRRIKHNSEAMRAKAGLPKPQR